MKTVVAGILERDARLLICQRRASDSYPLKWEFPGGKVRVGEQPAEALRRELHEELGIEAVIGPQTERYRFRYPSGDEFELVFFSVADFAGEPENYAFEQIRWVSRRELQAYDFLEGDRVLLERLLGPA